MRDDTTDDRPDAPLPSNRRAVAASRPSLGWILAIVGLALLFVARIVLASRSTATSPGGFDLADLATLAVILAAFGVAVYVPIQLGVARSVLQAEGVQHANPAALVIPANRPQDGKRGLGFLPGAPALHIFYTWAITPTELQIWQGGRVPTMVATIPWAAVEAVDTTNHSQGRRYPRMFPAVRLVFLPHFGFAASLEFFIRRPRHPMYPAPLSDVERAADQLSRYLAGRREL